MVPARADLRQSRHVRHVRHERRALIRARAGIAIELFPWGRAMAEYDERTSIPTLIRGLLDDARELIREELQLARAEIREEISAVQSAAIAFAIAGAVGLIGAMLLSVAIGGALAYFLRWPT